MLDGYRNVLMWETSRVVLTQQEKNEAEYRKSIAGYSAPWNPRINQKWLDLKTNKVMVNLGLPRWHFDDTTLMASSIPVEAPANHLSVDPGYPVQSYGPLTATKVEPVKPAAKPIPEDPEPPNKSRVFTFK